MTADEFDRGMALIYSRWDKKNYPEQLRLRIWYHCQILPFKSFERITLSLMDVSRTAPMPREFQLLAHAERDRLGLRGKTEPETLPSAQARCWDCGDSGNLFATHKVKRTSAVFRCHCEVGSRRPAHQGAQWSSVFEASHEKEPIHLGLKGDWRPRKGLSLVAMVQEMSGVRKEHRKSELRPAGEMFKRDHDDGGEGA